MQKAFTAADAKRFYDRLGRGQDLQAYERRALEDLLQRGRFDEAKHIAELGCGTGRLAERLLEADARGASTYTGFDVSETMVQLSRRRLRRFGARARIEQTDGTLRLPLDDESCDRFVATYVLDLLSEEHIRAALLEARRLLAPLGLLCVTGLTEGEGRLSRALCHLWNAAHAVSPHLVGGCRPVRVLPFVLEIGAFSVEHHAVHTQLGVPSEVLVARRA